MRSQTTTTEEYAIKTATDFIKDLRTDPNLRAQLDEKFIGIDPQADHKVFLQAIVEVGNAASYSFSANDYADAAYKYAQKKVNGIIKEPPIVLAGPWTTQGVSCTSACPTTNKAGCG